MQKQINNRYREYRVTVPAVVAQEIKNRAREEKTTEAAIINNLIVKGLTTNEAPVVTLNGEVVGTLA